MSITKKFQYNSPVVLTFALISFFALVLGTLTNGWTTYAFLAHIAPHLLIYLPMYVYLDMC